MKIPISLFFVSFFVSGCVSTNPPYVDPKKSQNFSHVVTPFDDKSLEAANLVEVDGKSAISSEFFRHNVTEVYVIPGTHKYLTVCYKGTINVYLLGELTFTTENKKTYNITCSSSEDGTKGIFEVRDAHTNEVIPFSFVKSKQ
jgi:hypothetical protein